jgi:hypothetical protein
MADVAGLAPELLARLDGFVRRGGTLVVFPGAATVPAGWRGSGGGGGGAGPLLPATLGAARDAADSGRAAKVIQTAGASDLLAGLADLAYYGGVVVSRYVVLGAADDRSDAETLLDLDTGDPLLVAGRRGRGRVYLWAVPAAGDWSNLQRTNVFLPLVVRMVHRGATRRSWPGQAVAGETIELDYRQFVADPCRLKVADPEHERSPRHLEADAGAGNHFTVRDTFALGFYEAAPDAAPPRPALAWTFAVNPDGAESDLTALDPEEIRGKLPGTELYLATSVADLEAQLTALGRTELWQHFLWFVLLLTVFECLVSNRLRTQRGRRGVATLVDRLRGRAGDVPPKAEEARPR